MKLHNLLPDVIESRETRPPVLKIKNPASCRCLQPQAANARLREEPSCEGDVIQNFPKSWRGSSSDAVDDTAHRDSDSLAGDTSLCSPGNTQAFECFFVHSLRQRLSVYLPQLLLLLENFTNVEVVDVNFPPPTRERIQRDRKGFASNEFCVRIETTTMRSTTGDDVAMKMLNHTHCRQRPLE